MQTLGPLYIYILFCYQYRDIIYWYDAFFMNQSQNMPGKLCNFMPGDALVIACSMAYLD